MYNGYNSLRDVIQREIESQKSVLNKFPESISRPITQSCSKYLAQFTSFQLPFKSDVASGPSATSSASSSSSAATSSAATSASSAAQSSTAGGMAKSQQLGTIQEGGGLSGGASNDLNSIVQSQGATATSGGQTSLSSGGHHHHQSSMMMLIPENMIQLETSEQVNWVLENLMYGLTLSHDYQDTIKDCWNVYHDWLCVLLDEPKPFLPQPIRDDPIVYARKMLWHLYHLFVPRKDSQAPTKHIMMCHGVLILIEGIAKDSKLLKRDLWEEFLKFFLAINDAVLAPAFNKDDFGEILSSRIVATLFEIWLIACNRVFPSPSLWRTFQELCANWRHHVSLVIEWNRVCHALTNRLLELTWWPDMSSQTGSRNPASNDTNVAYDIQTIIGQMNIETVIQTWFRFLHIIGRPVDFCDHHAISKMLEMVRLNRLAGLSKDGGSSLGSSGSGGSSANLDPSAAPTANFPCVKRLPIIFLEVIKGISRIVDAFLGQNTTSTLYQLVQQHHHNMQFNRQLNIGSISTTTTSSTTSVSFDQKSRSKSVLVTPTTTTTTIDLSSNSSTGSLASNASNARLNPYRLNRTSVNSLLHLVGQWLFEAASITSKEYILGQAEAYGILCKIFSSVRTNETISLDYLSRFYALLIQGLRVSPNLGELNSSTLEYEGGELLASIIVNGCNLFKLDFDGSSVVLLPMLNALHAVFKLKYTMREEPNRPKELVKSVFNIGAQSVTLVELKRYCIVIFNSLLSMPNHFGQVTLSETGLTYYSLRTKILEIFLAAMTNEQDTVNLQMLFGCGRLIVGEWALDESKKTSSEVAGLDKKERASYCYNQIVSLICAPLKIYNTTLQNHSFALSIFDTLASIAAAGDYLAGASGGEDDSICKLAISWIWHYVKMQIRRRSRDHTREMHSVIVAAYNCLIVLLITKPSVLKDKICLQTVANCIEIGISGSSSYPEQQKVREEASSTSSGNQGGSGATSSGVSGGGSGKEATPTGTTGTSSSSNNPGGGGSSSGAATSSTSGGAAGGGVGSGSGGGAGGSGSSGLTGGSGGLGANSTLLKAEKELKPASLRVKEAAECVLYYLMEHTSSAAGVLSDNSHDLTRVAIDEKSLIDLTGKPANSKFKYFAVDGSLIVAILEKPLVKTPISSLCPTVTIIIRGAFGRQAWSLHLRTNPFSDLENISVDSKGNAIPRALSMMNSMMESNRNSINNGHHHHHHHHHHHRHNIMRGGGGDSSTLKPMSNLTNTRDSNSNNGANNGEGKSAPTTTNRPKCELSIPSLSDVAENCVGAQLGRFQKLKEDQIDFELSAINRVLGENETYKNKQFGANYESLLSTKNCNDFQSARMLLSHLGYCSLARDISSSSTSTSDAPEIFSLDGNDVNFQDHLQLLDSLPTRTFSFSTIFYVKANQTNAKSILNNINLDEHLDENFYMFVQSLGSILDVNDLAKRKLAPQPNKDESTTSSYTRKLSKINGTENILYWSDTSSEICFTIPNVSTSSSGELAPSISPPGDDSNRAKYQSIPGDIRVLIVWLEQFQDADQIPIDELISESATVDTAPTQQQQQKQREIIVIFIHPLKNRLNRVSLWSSAARRHFYTMPLIDGMVVGSKMLSSMVRQTVLNIFRRKRLEIDDYQPPHVKRKNKITEMIKKHQTKKSEPDFFTSLLMGT